MSTLINGFLFLPKLLGGAGRRKRPARITYDNNKN